MKNAKMFMWHLTLAAALPVLFTGPAQAGFEWSPPPAAPAMTAAQDSEALPPVPATPAGNVEATELMPVPGTTESKMPPETLPPAASPATPVIERETQALPQPAIQEHLSPPPAAGSFAVAQGFGADIPLALALGQIVPAEYAYSFAASVNPGLKISWDGGKPWNIVLNEALAVHGLRADITGTAVVVRKGGAETAAPVNVYAQPLAAPDSSSMPASMSAPDDQQAAGDYTTTPRPPKDALSTTTSAAPAQAAPGAAMGGEGSANYPRRNAAKKGFFQSIFTPEEHKGNLAPRPPIDHQTPAHQALDNQALKSDGKVIVRNEVSAEELGAMNAAPAQAAALEPAAPALAPLPTPPALQTGGPIPLNTQKISYADEEARQRTDILPTRSLSDSVQAQANVLDPFQVSFWQADNNAPLREVLMGWAQKAGVEVIWDSGYDYKLPGSIALHGTFPEAVTRVFDLYGKAEPRPQGKLHPNLPKGPSVLLVENYP